ncbi:hypothetical protein ABTD31_19735, partial [Acinetobacter baumannii]
LGGAGVAVAAWLFAEYFTRKRRMALPSILLVFAFAGGVAATQIAIVAQIEPHLTERLSAIVGAGIAAVTALATWVHWRRFM